MIFYKVIPKKKLYLNYYIYYIFNIKNYIRRSSVRVVFLYEAISQERLLIKYC